MCYRATYNQQKSPLLRLPPEIHYQIFTSVLGGKVFMIQRLDVSVKFGNIVRPRHTLVFMSYQSFS